MEFRRVLFRSSRRWQSDQWADGNPRRRIRTRRHRSGGRRLRPCRTGKSLNHGRPKRGDRQMTAKNQVCLWYDHDAEEAAKLYAATFPDTRINCFPAAPGDYPDGQNGKTPMVELTIMGILTRLLNGGPTFPQSESFSRSEEHT